MILIRMMMIQFFISCSHARGSMRTQEVRKVKAFLARVASFSAYNTLEKKAYVFGYMKMEKFGCVLLFDPLLLLSQYTVGKNIFLKKFIAPTCSKILSFASVWTLKIRPAFCHFFSYFCSVCHDSFSSVYGCWKRQKVFTFSPLFGCSSVWCSCSTTKVMRQDITLQDDMTLPHFPTIIVGAFSCHHFLLLRHLSLLSVKELTFNNWTENELLFGTKIWKILNLENFVKNYLAHSILLGFERRGQKSAFCPK